MRRTGCSALNWGDDQVRAEWLLTFAPIVGMAANCFVQILCSRLLKLHIARALICGFLFGFLFTAILVASNGPPLASAGELTGLWLTSATTYIALAFGFWAFLNLNMTSLRIRMLREMLHAKRNMTRAELLDRYSPDEFLRRRLARLERSGQLMIKDGGYSLRSRNLLYASYCVNFLRSLVFAGTRKYDARN
jgi:hypothetical protein